MLGFTLYGQFRIGARVLGRNRTSVELVLGKFDSSGAILWHREWSETGVEIDHVTSDQSGHAVAIFWFHDKHAAWDFGCRRVEPSDRGRAVVRYDATGRCVSAFWFDKSEALRPVKAFLMEDGALELLAENSHSGPPLALLQYDAQGRASTREIGDPEEATYRVTVAPTGMWAETSGRDNPFPRARFRARNRDGTIAWTHEISSNLTVHGMVWTSGGGLVVGGDSVLGRRFRYPQN